MTDHRIPNQFPKFQCGFWKSTKPPQVQNDQFQRKDAMQVSKQIKKNKTSTCILDRWALRAWQVLANALYGNRSVVALDLQNTHLRDAAQAFNARKGGQPKKWIFLPKYVQR